MGDVRFQKKRLDNLSQEARLILSGALSGEAVLRSAGIPENLCRFYRKYQEFRKNGELRTGTQ